MDENWVDGDEVQVKFDAASDSDIAVVADDGGDVDDDAAGAGAVADKGNVEYCHSICSVGGNTGVPSDSIGICRE